MKILATMNRFATRLYKWYATAYYIIALVALSAYDGSLVASVIGMTAITYMLTASLRTCAVVDPTPIYGV